MAADNPLAYLGPNDASETVKGISRLATQAETTTGTSRTTAVTPYGAAALVAAGAPDASTTQKGIIEIATDGEATTKTASDLALVPSNIPDIMNDPGPIGGTTPSTGAFTTLSASGAFSLTGDQVQVAEGGTGASSLTDHGILLGSGTSAVTALGVGTDNQILIGQTGADPAWTTNVDLPGTLDVTGAAVLDDSLTVAGTSDFTGDVTMDTTTFFMDASQSNIGIGTITPAAANKVHVTTSSAGTATIVEIENSDNTNTASHSEVLVQTGGASGGDPKLVLDVDSVQQFYVGIDNTDSDILKIGSGAAVGTTSSVQLTDAGALSVLRGDVDITRSGGSSTDVTFTLANSDNANADSNAVATIQSGGGSGGDPTLVLDVNSVQQHYIGVDNSDSDKLIVGSGTAVGTNSSIELTAAGAMSVLRGNVDITRSEDGAAVSHSVVNSSDTADSTSLIDLQVAGTSAGDAYQTFTVSGGQVYSVGLDNSSTNDDFVISDNATLGTNNRISIDGSTGDVTIGQNLILGSVATQLQMNGGAVTDFIGSATLSSGTVTVANTNIAAGDRIFIQRQDINGSSAVGELTYSISAATSFTITSVQPGTPASTETNDASIVMYFIVRQN